MTDHRSPANERTVWGLHRRIGCFEHNQAISEHRHLDFQQKEPLSHIVCGAVELAERVLHCELP